MKNIKHIKPDHYDNFLCLASDCNYSCCREWEIHLSEDEYNIIKDLNISTQELKFNNNNY